LETGAFPVILKAPVLAIDPNALPQEVDALQRIVRELCEKLKHENAARQALCDTGMEWAEEKAPYQLSGGEKRRVAIAGVLAMQPDILVLDEPTTSLDPPSQYDLVAIVRNLPQAKIVATHDTAFASAIGTRAVFFQHGRIVAEGSVRDLANRFNWCAAEPKP
jgi:energy-coupling factor transporter ATP-binding protein EcfA2